MPERKVTPADCALLVGLPLSRAELLADMDDPRKDFARGLWAQKGERDTAAGDYEPDLAELRRSIRGAGRRTLFPWAPGATVVRATLESIGEAARAHHVLTLFAHVLRVRRVDPDEVLDPVEILRRVNRADHMTSEVVRAACPILSGLSGASPESARRAIALALTRLLVAGVSDEIHERLHMLPHEWTRVDFEEAFEPALVAAPMIELSDGLVSWTALRDALPLEFEGIIDLTLCFSTDFAESIKRPNRTFLVLANQGPTRLDLRARLYHGIVAALRKAPDLYSVVAHEQLQVIARSICGD